MEITLKKMLIAAVLTAFCAGVLLPVSAIVSSSGVFAAQNTSPKTTKNKKKSKKKKAKKARKAKRRKGR